MAITRSIKDVLDIVEKMKQHKVPGLDPREAFAELFAGIFKKTHYAVAVKDGEDMKACAALSVIDFFGEKTLWIHFIWSEPDSMDRLKDDVIGLCVEVGAGRISGIMKKNYNAAMKKYGFYEDGVIVTKRIKGRDE
jgi:hypothetical protein